MTLPMAWPIDGAGVRRYKGEGGGRIGGVRWEIG